MRIVFGTKISRAPVLKALEEIDGIELVALDDLDQVAPLVGEADALIISDPRGADGKAIADELRKPGCRVRWIQFLSAGYQGLSAHGIPDRIAITNQGGAVAPAVADHAMALILAMARQLKVLQERCERHEWNKTFDILPMSLEGRVLVIIGFGNLGRQLAKRARGFDMKVVGVTRSPAPNPLADEMHPMSAMHEQLGRADVVALCIAATNATRHIIDARAFDAMKEKALFINVTRGETVDQDALRKALVDGHLASAAVDVTDPEPLPRDDPLWSAPNILITPHMSGAGGTGTGKRIVGVVRENVERFKSGRELVHLVKP